MAHIVVMPRSGQTMEEGSVQEWLKQEGELVLKGEPLFTILTDKATLEVESDYSGVLRCILITPEDGDVPCLAPLAIIANSDEDINVQEIPRESTEA